MIPLESDTLKILNKMELTQVEIFITNTVKPLSSGHPRDLPEGVQLIEGVSLIKVLKL